MLKGNGDIFLPTAEQGDLAKDKMLVESETAVDTLDKDKYSALADASKHGHIHIVQHLVNNNTDLNYANNDGMIPLMYAAEAGNENVVKLLVQSGADLAAKIKDGKTAEALAKNAAIKALLNAPPPVVKAASTPVSSTAEQVIAAMLKCKSNIAAMVQQLDKQELEKKDEFGRTPLYCAADFGRLDIVTLLVEAGADLNSVDQYSYSVLSAAARSGALNVVKYLCSKGVDIHKRNTHGENALYGAASRGKTEVMTFLLDQGADMHCTGVSGRTALMDACSLNRCEAVEVLLQRGGKLNDVDNCGLTPLMYACRNGSSNAVKLLLKWGASPNEVNSQDGCTPLMCAAKLNYAEVVKVLLQAGADPTVRNKDGELAIDLASNQATKDVLSSCAVAPSEVHPPQDPPVAIEEEGEKDEEGEKEVEEDPSMYDPVLPTDPLIARQAELEGKCATIAVQVAGLPAFLSWLQRRDAAQAALAPVLHGTDYATIATHGVALAVIEQEASKLALTEAECATLSTRHGEAVAEVAEFCKELRAAKQFPALIALGTKLEEFQAMDLSSIPPNLSTALPSAMTSPNAPAPPPLAPLQAKQKSILGQAQYTSTTRAWIQRRDQVKERLRAADEAAKPDFVLIGKLSLELDDVNLNGAQLLLSEEDYKTLATRHAAVVAETESMCAALVQARAYVELQQQAERLAALRGVEIAPLACKP